MATRREICKWCQTGYIVSNDAQSITCPRCRVTVHYPRNNTSGGFSPYANSNVNVRPIPAGFSMFNNSAFQSVATRVHQKVNNEVQRVQSLIRAHTKLPSLPGKKQAVLCGVSYMGHPKSLKASIGNVSIMKQLLIEKMGFPYGNVVVLAEDENDPYRIPTKANIRAAMRWLVQGCQGGDSLVFYYTGHGSKVQDTDGDETDGHDEAICPVDYESEGRILDDEINNTMVRSLPHGVTLHAIIDTCFSGTLLDLPYTCRVNREGYYLWENQSTTHYSTKGTQGGLAICISACDEHQTSGDTTTFTGSPAGALTYSFAQLLEEEETLTYGQLLNAMRYKVYKAQKAANQGYPLAYHLWQEPQLSASESFDIHLKQFIL